MLNADTFHVTTPSDVEIQVTRRFNAPRALVFDAFTKPELVRRWLIVGDWAMTTCTIDLKVGGTFRYAWDGGGGQCMGMTGTFREIQPPERIVHDETFDEPWYPGSAQVTTVFGDAGGQTDLTLTIRYESKEARDIALQSPMKDGMAQTYNLLEEALPDMAGA